MNHDPRLIEIAALLERIAHAVEAIAKSSNPSYTPIIPKYRESHGILSEIIGTGLA